MENSANVLKDIASSTFQDITEFYGYSRGLSHHLKTNCFMNKPIFIGSTVSKKLMYEFYYDYVKPKWGDRVKLLFTDTDSFCLEIQTEDVYKDIAPDIDEWFDTSNYPKYHPSGIRAGINKMVPGKMKDELAGNQVQEFCGLNAKTYSFDNGERKAKGVNRASKKEYLTHEDYVRILNEQTDKEIECIKIGSKKFRLTTRKETKVGLTHTDKKTYNSSRIG